MPLPVAVARPGIVGGVKAELEQVAGDRGTVFWFADEYDPTHAAVGWYFRPRIRATGCSCIFCAAESVGADVFLATGGELAEFRLRTYAAAHTEYPRDTSGRLI